MHTFIPSIDGWRKEYLRDDAEVEASDKFKGCSFLEEIRENERYVASIRYQEHLRDERITVEAVVYQRKGTTRHKSLEDALLLEKDEFNGSDEGKSCRVMAAEYALQLKERINTTYFTTEIFSSTPPPENYEPKQPRI